jgi:arylsulfatase
MNEGSDTNVDRLNVLLITADQYRGDFLSCAGHPMVRTPHLDALGRRGAYFPNSFSPVPVCVPARYAIMTGRSPISFGMRDNQATPMPVDVVTLPTAFGRAGYTTAAIGKMHFTPWREPHGFEKLMLSEEGRKWDDPGGPDDYQRYLREVGWGGYERAHAIGNNDVCTSSSPLPLEHYHTVWAARETQRWIGDHVRAEAQQPFFAWCSFTKPHSPYDPPEPYDRMYDARSFPPPIGDASDLAELSPHYEHERRRHLFDTLGPEQIQRARAFYAGNCTLIDQMVGELWQTLEELGLAKETIVLFTADHGDLLGDHGLFFKRAFFRGAWHVPFFLYAPGQVESLGRTERFTCTEDVYTTLLSLAGVGDPSATSERSVTRAPFGGIDVTADEDGRPDTVFGSVRHTPNQVHSVRTTSWSYVVHPRGAYEELYDLHADPDERRNLAVSGQTAAVSGILSEFRTRVAQWLTALGDTTSVDDRGHLRLDSHAHGWDPGPAPRTGLGRRPY